MEEETKKQPPQPPLLRGNISDILRCCPCPAVLMVKVSLTKRGVVDAAESS
jgi:hypothetical protein